LALPQRKAARRSGYTVRVKVAVQSYAFSATIGAFLRTKAMPISTKFKLLNCNPRLA
jgi:hypothetical protein